MTQSIWKFGETDATIEQRHLESNRDYQRRLMSDKRAGERDIEIGVCADPARRQRYRTDPEGFCQWYFGHIFYNPFTDDQRTMIDAVVGRIHHGGCQAVAAARGDGKSSITKCVGGVWALVYGYIKYLVLVGANADFARSMLTDIKNYFEFNERLAADFPEVCDPIRALEGAAQRAKSQTAGGRRTGLVWQGHEIVMADVDGSDAAGAIITTRGIDGAIRGMVRAERRPDMVIIDDCETRESAKSLSETESRRETIQKDILGLAGPGRSMAAAMLCTIIRKGCLADEYTDRQIQPSWGGIRQRFLLTPPTASELWIKYIDRRRTDQINGDPYGRTAHAFYLDQQAAMDAGSATNNPWRFDGKELPDGSQMEVSAIQHAMNKKADMGDDAFNAEMQNDPSELSAETTGINVSIVCKKLSHTPRGVVPAWAERVCVGIDVGGRALHWAAVAVRKGLRGAVIDYGLEPVHSPAGRLTSSENLQHTQEAILSALATWRDWHGDHGWAMADSGELRMADLILVDSGAGHHLDPVYQFCRVSSQSLFRPIKGFGQNQPGGRYKVPSGKAADRAGKHYHQTRQPGGVWLTNVDADYYKNAVHTGFLTPDGLPGSLSLYGSEASHHHDFARQICAEIWTREFRPGKGWIEGFDVIHHANHFLDATAYGLAAADMVGLRVVEDTPGPAEKRVTLSELQRRRRGG